VLCTDWSERKLRARLTQTLVLLSQIAVSGPDGTSEQHVVTEKVYTFGRCTTDDNNDIEKNKLQ